MHTGQVRRPILLLVLATFWLASCSWLPGEDDDAPAGPTAQPTPTERMTLADLGLAGWPVADEPELPDAPTRPASIPAAEYDRMVEAVETWSVQAATDPDAVGEGLPKDLVEAIDDAVGAQTVPALARATVLDPDLDVNAARMTGAWRVAEEDGAVNLSLQTRTAYEVRAPGGQTRVIGVLRTQGVVAVPGTEQWGTIMGWQEFGAADCAIVLDEFLTPGGDPDDQESDLTVFAEIGKGSEAVTPKLPENEYVDEDFAQACRSGRV